MRKSLPDANNTFENPRQKAKYSTGFDDKWIWSDDYLQSWGDALLEIIHWAEEIGGM